MDNKEFVGNPYMGREHWEDEESTLEECIMCGKQKNCQYAYDPFASEVFGKEEDIGYWCFDCHEGRLDDI